MQKSSKNKSQQKHETRQSKTLTVIKEHIQSQALKTYDTKRK